MARELRSELVDDVDGSPATQTVEFTVAGRCWSIDLNDAHAREFMNDMMRWTRYARRTDIALGTNRVAARRDPAQTRAIRQWAAGQGLEFNPRGKLDEDIVQAYEDAHQVRTRPGEPAAGSDQPGHGQQRAAAQ